MAPLKHAVDGKTIAELAREEGVPYQTMYWRLVGANARRPRPSPGVRPECREIFNELLGIGGPK